MPNSENRKPYDLEARTFQFAKASRSFVKGLPRTIANIEDVKQFVRASGSIGANYIEANEAIGKKDFAMKIKICRREAKESSYWLRLIDAGRYPRETARRTGGGINGINEDLRRNCAQIGGNIIRVIFTRFDIVSGFEIRISDFLP
jgi:four helix bundle protein